jgi:hypothetical protein
VSKRMHALALDAIDFSSEPGNLFVQAIDFLLCVRNPRVHNQSSNVELDSIATQYSTSVALK